MHFPYNFRILSCVLLIFPEHKVYIIIFHNFYAESYQHFHNVFNISEYQDISTFLLISTILINQEKSIFIFSKIDF